MKLCLFFKVRPKSVQSTRFARGMTYVPKDVREWKREIVSQLRAQLPEGYKTYDGPVQVDKLVYTFKFPSNSTPAMEELVHLYNIQGKTKAERFRNLVEYSKEHDVAFLAKADLMDNLNKGLLDCLTGIVYSDDKNIWRCNGEHKKVYGEEDSIYMELKLGENE